MLDRLLRIRTSDQEIYLSELQIHLSEQFSILKIKYRQLEITFKIRNWNSLYVVYPIPINKGTSQKGPC